MRKQKPNPQNQKNEEAESKFWVKSEIITDTLTYQLHRESLDRKQIEMFHF